VETAFIETVAVADAEAVAEAVAYQFHRPQSL
jgi:hypothetical protein